jgi:hypothetical protein
MLKKELTILKELWNKILHLIGVTLMLLMVLVAIVSSLLVASIVNISVLVGVIRMKVKGYVYSSMQMETGILHRLEKLLTWRR